MSQRRRVAVSYLFAVPVVLAIVLVQHVAFLRLGRAEGALAETAGAVPQSEVASSVQPVATADNGGRSAQARAVSQAQNQDLVASAGRQGAETRAAQRARLLE